MKQQLKRLEAVILFLLIWIILNENARPMTILLGVLFSIVALVMSNKILGIDYGMTFYEPPYLLVKYFLTLIVWVYKSGFDMMKRIVKGDVSPTFVKYESKLKAQVSLVLLSNSITLTPGTATMERDGANLTILSADPDEAVVREGIAVMEATLEHLEDRRGL